MLHNSLKPENLSAGFKATGIHPVDRRQVLRHLPAVNEEGGSGTTSTADFNDSILQRLLLPVFIKVSNVYEVTFIFL